MIKSLSLENFQSHVYSALFFHKGVNVITGVSDSGKSAIIKAFNWIINNRPSGEDFKNWNASEKDQMAAEITTEDNSIAIMRNNNKTIYTTKDQTFSAIKTDVPEEIKNILNIADYNIQTQFQSYFLLQDSPGEVARKLNELVGLDIIDILYKNIASEIRETNSLIVSSKNERDSINEDLKKYENLADIEKIIKTIEKTYQENAVIESSLSFLKEKSTLLEEIKTERNKLNTILCLESKQISILKEIDENQITWNYINNLKTVLKNLTELKEETEEDTMWLEIEKPCIDILNQIEQLSETSSKQNELTSSIKTFTNIKDQQKRETQKRNESKIQYMKLLTTAKICPTCASKIDQTRLKEIEKSL